MMGSGPKPTQQRMTFKQMKQQNKASTTLIEQQEANQQDDFVPQTQYANTSLEQIESIDRRLKLNTSLNLA